jgi:hypothetical protein
MNKKNNHHTYIKTIDGKIHKLDANNRTWVWSIAEERDVALLVKDIYEDGGTYINIPKLVEKINRERFGKKNSEGSYSMTRFQTMILSSGSATVKEYKSKK